MPTDTYAPVGGEHCKKERTMSEQPPEPGEVPMMQKLLDNPFLLLFIGVASPSLLYLVWGIMEIVTIPAR
jgi:hypothetical protein